MKTKLEVCNMALALIGQGRTITSVASDNTNEAASIRIFYDGLLEQMLREFQWPFSTSYKALDYAHDGYGLDLSISDASIDAQSDAQVALSSIDTTSNQHIDVVVSTVFTGVTSGGHVKVTLEGGTGDFGSGTTTQVLGYFKASPAVGDRITASIPVSSLTYSDYKIKLTPSGGSFTAGAVSAFMAERESAPVDEWDYAYEYPSDALYIVRIGSDTRNDVYDTRIPFKIVHREKVTDLSGANYVSEQQILSGVNDAVVEYVTNRCLVANESTDYVFPEDFAMAFAHRLAIAIYPRMTSGDNGLFLQALANNYRVELSRAQANAANEQGYDIPRESEYSRARL